MRTTHCPKCGKLVPGVDAPTFTPSLREACKHIFDMLLADDGQAWSEAERFLKAHAPDLYNRIGMPKGKKDE